MLIYTGEKHNSSVWRLSCAILMELLSVCAISSPPLLTLVHLDAFWQLIKHVFAHVTKEDQRSWLMWQFDILLLHSALSLSPFLKGSALCSCFWLFFLFFYIYIYKYSTSFTLLWRVCRLVWVRSVKYQLMTRQMSIAATSNTSCLVFVPYDLTNAHTWRYASGPERVFTLASVRAVLE